MELKDKVVAITGGNKGFGKALTEVFTKEGAKVAICGLNTEELNQTSKEFGVLSAVADVRDVAALENFIDKTEKELGPIDIWVNNSGLWLNNQNAELNDLDKVKTMVDVNVTGLINGSILALRRMKPRNSGMIVNILSGAATGSKPGIATYAATKWAGRGLTDSLREENKDTNLKFISICPGGMKTTIFGDYKYSEFGQFMDPLYVAHKAVDNIKKDVPDNEMVIRRPAA